MLKQRLLFNEIKPYFHSPEAIVITGMRRTGKTTILSQIYSEIDSKNKLFLDLENPLNRKYFEDGNYERIKSSLEFLGLDFTAKVFIFLDEIQFLRNLPSVVKYLVDHYNAKFFLTGSASFYLKNLFAESLAGRKYIFELFPLSFNEFLRFKDASFAMPSRAHEITRHLFDSISPLYDEYVMFGGFPGVVLKTSVEEKKKVLDDIFSSFFQMEVIGFGDFRRNEAVRDLMLLLLERIGSKLDVQKLSKEIGVSRPTINAYLSLLEDTYFIKTIRPFGRGVDTEIRKMPKVYACDCGLANHHAKLDMGALFENSVFQNLRLKGKLNYYQKKNGVEIDFILDKKIAFEVKTSARDSDIKKLQKTSEALSLEENSVVSRNFSELKNIKYAFML
ncbi:ATP-binding protein [Elusimicrobiota bacterium]